MRALLGVTPLDPVDCAAVEAEAAASCDLLDTTPLRCVADDDEGSDESGRGGSGAGGSLWRISAGVSTLITVGIGGGLGRIEHRMLLTMSTITHSSGSSASASETRRRFLLGI